MVSSDSQDQVLQEYNNFHFNDISCKVVLNKKYFSIVTAFKEKEIDIPYSQLKEIKVTDKGFWPIVVYQAKLYCEKQIVYKLKHKSKTKVEKLKHNLLLCKRNQEKENNLKRNTFGVDRVIKTKKFNTNRDKTISNEATEDLASLISSATAVSKIISKYMNLENVPEDGVLAAAREMGLTEPADAIGASDLDNPRVKEIFRISNNLFNTRKLRMIGLHELYCLVNRVLITDIFSPSDILKACEMISEKNKNFILKKFNNGSIMLLSSEMSGKHMLKNILQYLEEHKSVTCSSFASAFDVPYAIAETYLYMAEIEEEALCRDESIEGITYYPNKFLSAEVSQNELAYSCFLRRYFMCLPNKYARNNSLYLHEDFSLWLFQLIHLS